MSEELVLIHTYASPVAAGAAQGELLAAGIQSILVSETPSESIAPLSAGVALAVHRRDAELAATVLALEARRDEAEPGAAGDSNRA